MQRACLTYLLCVVRFGLALSFFGAAAPGDAKQVEGTSTANAVVEDVASRRIVLRSVRMPDTFGTHLLALDHKARLIDRKRKVAAMADADVWIVGLRDWSDIDWLMQSPLHSHFAKELRTTAPDIPLKSFQWNAGHGRILDLHFVNLAQATLMPETCLAQTLYRLSQVFFQDRNGKDLLVASARVEPILPQAGLTGELDYCG